MPGLACGSAARHAAGASMYDELARGRHAHLQQEQHQDAAEQIVVERRDLAPAALAGEHADDHAAGEQDDPPPAQGVDDQRTDARVAGFPAHAPARQHQRDDDAPLHQRDGDEQQVGDLGERDPRELRAALQADREQQVDREQLEHRLGQLEFAADEPGDRAEHEGEHDRRQQVGEEQIEAWHGVLDSRRWNAGSPGTMPSSNQ
jgi:hypothetical protein